MENRLVISVVLVTIGAGILMILYLKYRDDAKPKPPPSVKPVKILPQSKRLTPAIFETKQLDPSEFLPKPLDPSDRVKPLKPATFAPKQLTPAVKKPTPKPLEPAIFKPRNVVPIPQELRPASKTKPIKPITPSHKVKEWSDLKPSHRVQDLSPLYPSKKVKPLEPLGPSSKILPWNDLKPSIHNKPVEPITPATYRLKPIIPHPQQLRPSDSEQQADLRLVNNCEFPIWVEGRATVQNPKAGDSNKGQFSTDPREWIAGAPIPGYENKNPIKLKPQDHFDYKIPDYGLAGTKFWAKYNCDESGTNCDIGDQMQYWKGWNSDKPADGGCPPLRGCTPPIDSIFEATWGCSKENPDLCSRNPSKLTDRLDNKTHFDTSHVDGYTLPYSVKIKGATSQCDYDPATGKYRGLTEINGSKLDPARCPDNEDLSLSGKFPTARDVQNNKEYNLTSTNLQYLNKSKDKILGCTAPCKQLSGGYPQGFNQSLECSSPTNPRPLSEPAVWYCCPTPGQYACGKNGDPCPNLPSECGGPDKPATCNKSRTCDTCTAAVGCTSADSCSAGPTGDGKTGIRATKYVNLIHETAPDIYAYAYDDGLGLHNCPAGKTKYEMTFCPPGSPKYPADR